MAVVAYHSQTRNGVRVSNVVSVVLDKKPEVEQITLFSREVWEAEMVRIIRKFKTFYPSDIRRICTTLPPFDNDSGPFYRRLMDNKKIRRTGNWRKSSVSSRKGGAEFEYENVMGDAV